MSMLMAIMMGGVEGGSGGSITDPDNPNLGFFYTADDVSGNAVNDSSPNNFDATMSGSSASVTGGVVGNQFDFPLDTSLLRTDASAASVNKFSLALWVDTTNTTTVEVLAELTDNSNIVTGGWYVGSGVFSAGDFSFVFRKVGGGAFIGASSAGSTNDGSSKYFIVATYDSSQPTVASQVTLYHGVFGGGSVTKVSGNQGSNTAAVSTANQPINFGRRNSAPPNAFGIDGHEDQIRYFPNYVLSDAEVDELFNSGVGI